MQGAERRLPSQHIRGDGPAMELPPVGPRAAGVSAVWSWRSWVRASCIWLIPCSWLGSPKPSCCFLLFLTAARFPYIGSPCMVETRQSVFSPSRADVVNLRKKIYVVKKVIFKKPAFSFFSLLFPFVLSLAVTLFEIWHKADVFVSFVLISLISSVLAVATCLFLLAHAEPKHLHHFPKQLVISYYSS